jgi:N-methylhydantoinase A
VLDDLTARASRQLDADGIALEQRRYHHVAECRYVGQGFELRADVPQGRLGKASAEAVIENFYNVHKQVYGHAFRDQSCEIVTLRTVATVAVDTLELPKLGRGERRNPTEAELYRRRTVFDNGEALETPRYSREKLLADDTLSGPALVIQHNSTTIVPPGYVATVMDYGDMLIRRK